MTALQPRRSDERVGDEAPGAVVVGEGVTAAYGRHVVLDAIDFSVGPGVTGLLGPNGSGKTTLLGHVLGLRRPRSGSLRVFGMDPAARGAEVRSRIGYAPEHHLLPDDVPAHDFVRHVGEIHGLPRREAVSRASDSLWWTGLQEERFRALGTLSTGQRQRVKLAAAIAHDPALVILDEPTDGLDPSQRDDMLRLISRIGGEFGMSVLLSSHQLDEVERTCESVLMIAGGGVAVAGSLEGMDLDRGGVLVELAGSPDAVITWLEAAGCSITRDGSRLIVDGESSRSELYDIVRNAVVIEHVGLRRLGPNNASLEEVFLEADH